MSSSRINSQPNSRTPFDHQKQPKMYNNHQTNQTDHNDDNDIVLMSKLETSVNTLFKGLKRKVSQRQYSKLKNTYKLKSAINKNVVDIGANANGCAAYSSQSNMQSGQEPEPFSLISNYNNFSRVQPQKSFRILKHDNSKHQKNVSVALPTNWQQIDASKAAQELLQMKQNNHRLEEQNTQLLRKVRKEQKIQDIYHKRMQGKSLDQIDYFKALQVKLLLNVEELEDKLEQREKQEKETIRYIRKKKNQSDDVLIQRRIEMYKTLLKNQKDIHKIQSQQVKKLQRFDLELQTSNSKLSIARQRTAKTLQISERLQMQISSIKNKIKKFQLEAAEINGFQQNSSSNLRNGSSMLTIKHKSNVEDLQKQIASLKEQSEMMDGIIQEFMDAQIKKKIILYQEIDTVEANRNRLKEKLKKIKQNKMRSSIHLI